MHSLRKRTSCVSSCVSLAWLSLAHLQSLHAAAEARHGLWSGRTQGLDTWVASQRFTGGSGSSWLEASWLIFFASHRWLGSKVHKLLVWVSVSNWYRHFWQTNTSPGAFWLAGWSWRLWSLAYRPSASVRMSSCACPWWVPWFHTELSRCLGQTS